MSITNRASSENYMWVPCNDGKCCQCSLGDGFDTEAKCIKNFNVMASPQECCASGCPLPSKPPQEVEKDEPHPQGYSTSSQTWLNRGGYTSG